MSIHYFAMVRRAPACPDCSGSGGGDGDDCPACNGTGQLPERLVLHRDGKLYDEPGKASGSARRAGYDPIVYKLDTDGCDPVDTKMSLDEKIGHAETKYIYWAARLEYLQAQAKAQETGVPASPTLHRHDPKLTAEDFEALRDIVRNSLDHVMPSGHPMIGLERRAHFVDVAKRLGAKVYFDEMDAQASRSHAEVVRFYNDWAAGKGSRKCLRVGEVNVFNGTAPTACGDNVPAPASTTERAEMACAGCEGALRRAGESP